MKRWLWVACGIVLLVNPHGLNAQRRGGRGAGAGRTPTGVQPKDDLKDFNKAIALQATPDQVQQYRELSGIVEAARKSAQDLLLAANGSNPKAFQNQDSLSDAVAEAHTANEKFVRSFSAAQKAGLKAQTKKLEKSNSEIAKHIESLARVLGQGAGKDKQISSAADKLEKALSTLQANQRLIGDEMGIQNTGAQNEVRAQ
jgi:hypothetical protein